MLNLVKSVLRFFGFIDYPGDKPVHIFTAPNEPEAEVWKEVLQQGGVHVVLRKMPRGLSPANNTGFKYFDSPYAVLVLQSQVPRAYAILQPNKELPKRR